MTTLRVLALGRSELHDRAAASPRAARDDTYTRHAALYDGADQFDDAQDAVAVAFPADHLQWFVRSATSPSRMRCPLGFRLPCFRFGWLLTESSWTH
jgi:hypothetical protein